VFDTLQATAEELKQQLTELQARATDLEEDIKSRNQQCTKLAANLTDRVQARYLLYFVTFIIACLLTSLALQMTTGCRMKSICGTSCTSSQQQCFIIVRVLDVHCTS
jgi:hypothetical protein